MSDRTPEAPWIKLPIDLPDCAASSRLGKILRRPDAWANLLRAHSWCRRFLPSRTFVGAEAVAIFEDKAGWTRGKGHLAAAAVEVGFAVTVEGGLRLVDIMDVVGADWSRPVASAPATPEDALEDRRAKDRARKAAKAAERKVRNSAEGVASHARNSAEHAPEFRGTSAELPRNDAERDSLCRARETKTETQTQTKTTTSTHAERAAERPDSTAEHGDRPAPVLTPSPAKPSRQPRPQKAPADPAAAAEREAERADGDRWRDAYLAATGTPLGPAGWVRWQDGAWMAFRRQRTARGIEVLLDAVRGLVLARDAGHRDWGFWSTKGPSAWLSEAAIVCGLGHARSPPRPDPRRPYQLTTQGDQESSVTGIVLDDEEAA